VTVSDTNDRNVISAFVDDEPFDPAELGQALSDPAGRQMLIDFLSLRQLVVEDGPQTSTVHGHNRSAWAGWLVAAALALVIGGTWFISPRSSAAPPRPDRVVALQQGIDWHEK
jgi:hypothetical protein